MPNNPTGPNAVQTEIVRLKQLYAPLLDQAPTFNKYKQLQLSMEEQIRKVATSEPINTP